MRNLVNMNLKNIEEGYGISILGCFARSFDESHNKNNSIHLICSIVLLNSNLNIDELENNISLSLWKNDERDN